MRLSDLFENPNDLGLPEKAYPLLELEVQVLNINEGRNSDIVNRCKKLSEYSLFISKVREYKEKYDDLLKAIKEALKYCMEHDILKEYLEKHETEVINMLYTEWNWDTALEVAREEAFEDGLEEGEEKGREEGKVEEKLAIARNALAEGYSPESIQKITGLSLDEIAKL